MAASPGNQPPLFPRWIWVAGVIIAVLAAVLLLRGGSPPCGGAPVEGPYARSVVAFIPGRIQADTTLLNPACALGRQDHQFVSLGIGDLNRWLGNITRGSDGVFRGPEGPIRGQLILDMGRPVKDVGDLILWEANGVVSQPWTPTPVKIQLRDAVVNAVQVKVTASPAWPLGGDEIVIVILDPSSNFTRVILFDASNEPVKRSSGFDLDAVEISLPPA